MRYYIPEWDDQVDPAYNFEHDEYSPRRNEKGREDVYMWEIFRDRQIPFDGLLVSLMAIKTNGTKQREIEESGGLHAYLRLPSQKPILADCGAWGYIKSDRPKFDPIGVLLYYRDLGVQEGVTVDHLAIPSFVQNGEVVNVNAQERIKITYDYGIRGFEEWRKRYRDDFCLLVSVQGSRVDDYLDIYGKYVQHGISSFAFGGLAKKPTQISMELIDALIANIKNGKSSPVRIHFFGLGRVSLLSKFRELEEMGVDVSFDTASWLRRSWLSGDYYLIHKGQPYVYTAIRVPITDSERTSFRGKRKLSQGADLDSIKKLERQSLESIRSYDRDQVKVDTVLSILKKFNRKLLQERLNATNENTEDGNDRTIKMNQLQSFYSKLAPEYKRMLIDRPWRKCNCEICRKYGVEVILFRGNDRNRRRGFHNVYTMYNGLLKRPELWHLKFQSGLSLKRVTINDLVTMNGRVLVITGCTKTKLGYNSRVRRKAKEMYLGQLFKKVKDYCKLKNFALRILSAKYGLISPNEVIGGYEKTLRTSKDIESIKSQATKVLSSTKRNYDRVIVIAGEKYRRALLDGWDTRFCYLKGNGYADLCKKLKNVNAELSNLKIDAFTASPPTRTEVSMLTE